MGRLFEELRDLAALLVGLVAGTGARGLKLGEANVLAYLLGRRLGRVERWGFRATQEGPRSDVVARILDELIDAGVLTWRFERGAVEDPFYAIVEPEAVEWIPRMEEYRVGFEEADRLFHRARLTGLELVGYVYLLCPEGWSSRPEKLERLKARIAARLVARGLLDVEEAARLAGVSVEEMRRLVEEAREEVELGLPLEED